MRNFILTFFLVATLLLTAFMPVKDVSPEIVVYNDQALAREGCITREYLENAEELIMERQGWHLMHIPGSVIDDYEPEDWFLAMLKSSSCNEEVLLKVNEVLEEMERNPSSGFKARKIAQAYGMDKDRITLKQFLSIVEDLQCTFLIEQEIAKIHGPYDLDIGSGISIREYWLNDSGSIRITIHGASGRITYHNDDLSIAETLFDPYDIYDLLYK